MPWPPPVTTATRPLRLKRSRYIGSEASATNSSAQPVAAVDVERLRDDVVAVGGGEEHGGADAARAASDERDLFLQLHTCLPYAAISWSPLRGCRPAPFPLTACPTDSRSMSTGRRAPIAKRARWKTRRHRLDFLPTRRICRAIGGRRADRCAPASPPSAGGLKSDRSAESPCRSRFGRGNSGTTAPTPAPGH